MFLRKQKTRFLTGNQVELLEETEKEPENREEQLTLMEKSMALLKAEQERGPDFLRLGNALTALYPKGSEEKRLLDAMLLAVPR